ncbi:MAG: helix-turn-helix domain-containing protein [Candidatus Omnitrophica bacterium]|nr:helix-turn-helix domain-containing protein [Candidatus Omnitrophota bacterium]
MTEKQILAKIEAYMEKNNLRQYEFARMLDIPESTVNRWLKEKTNISKAYQVILKQRGVI